MGDKPVIYYLVYEAYRELYKVQHNENAKLKDYKAAVEKAMEFLGEHLDKEQ